MLSPQMDGVGVADFVPGSIVRVELLNFMNHESLLFELSPFVNFITGSNGTGKSALLIAICVGLGSTPRACGRDIPLEGLIRRTTDDDGTEVIAPFARTVVYIRNRLECPFFETYTEVIKVSRTIRSNSSSFQINDEEKGGQAHVRDRLRSILSDLHLDPHNPMIMMHQETVRSFHFCDPTGNYRLLERSMGTAGLQQQLDDMKVQLQQKMMGSKRQKVEFMFLNDRYEDLALEVQLVRQAEAIAEEVRQLEAEYAWALFREARASAQEIGKRVAELAKVVEDGASEYGSAERACQDALNVQNLAKEAVDRHRNEAVPLLARKRAVQEQIRALRDRLAKAKGHESALNGTLEKMLVRAANAREELASELAAIEELARTQKEIREEALRTLGKREEEQDAYNRRCEETVLELAKEAKAAGEALSTATSVLQGHSRRVGQLESKLATAPPHASGRRAEAGGDYDARVLSSEPIGPIGQYVNVPDPAWQFPYLEVCGGWLNYYIVSSHSDERALREMMRRDVPVLVTQYTSEQPTGVALGGNDSPRLLDKLEIVSRPVRHSGGEADTAPIISRVLSQVARVDRIWCLDREDDAADICSKPPFREAIAPTGVRFKYASGFVFRQGTSREATRNWIPRDEHTRLSRMELEKERAECASARVRVEEA